MEPHLKDSHIQVIKEASQQERFIVGPQEKGKATKSALYSQNAHWIYGILKITPEFMKVLFAETHSKLGKVGQSYWALNPKTDFAWGGSLTGVFLLKRVADGESLISASSSFLSDKQ